MASRKEYELLFLLNASLGTNYQATFKQAQAALLSYQKEIVALNQAQSDISAYERAQQELAKQNQKLSDLKAKLAQVNEEYAKGNITKAEYTSQTQKLGDQSSKTEEKIQKYTTRIQELETALKQDGVNTADLINEKKRLEAELEELRKKEEDAAKSAQELGDKSVDAFQAMGEAIVATGILDGLKALASEYKECIDIATQFGWEMANVTSIAGASGGEIEALAEKAKDLGASTKFTATEAAEAMGSMAMAGWKTEDMLAGMEGVVNLAAAANEDLATTSSIVSDSLAAFGLEASDTSHFADVLAAAATNSNTTVSLIGETFKYAASSAGALGYTVEDLAVAMGVMANRGIKGSMAGTSLRTTLSKLAAGATLTSEAFGDYEFTAVKADGTMKTFSETINELRGKFSEMTEIEKVSNAQAIAGTRSYNGLLAIINASDEEYQSLTESINNCSGAAQKMADTKMDSVQGDLYLMASAVDALKTTLGELSEGVLRTLYQRLTDLADKANEFVKEHETLVKSVLSGIAVFGTLTAGIVAVSTAVKTATAVMKALSAAGLLVNGALNPAIAIATGVAVAIGAVTAAFVAYNNRLVDGEHTYKELTESANSLKEEIVETASVLKDNATETYATAEAADHYIDRLEAMEAAGDGGAEASEEYRGTLQLLAETIPEIADQIDLENGCLLTSTKELRKNTKAWKENALAQAYQEQLTELYQKQAAAEIEKQKNLARMKDTMDEVSAAEERYNELYTEGEVSGYAKEWNDYANAVGNGRDGIQTVSEETRKWHEDLVKVTNEVDEGKDKILVYKDAYEEGASAVAYAGEEIEYTTEALNGLTEAEGNTADGADKAATKTAQMDQPFANIINRVKNLADAYDEAYQAALESIRGQFALWDEAAEREATSIDDINKNLEGQTEYWEAYNEDLDTLTGMTDKISGLSEVLASFADGSKESVDAVAGMAKAADESPDKLQQMVTQYQKLQEEQDKAAESIQEYSTNFNEVMDGIVSDFENDIDQLDFSNEAKEAARETIQAYVDQANLMGDKVASAFELIAQKARLKLTGRTNQISGEEDLKNNTDTTVPVPVGYASGTNYAYKGIHLVGEYGPELVFMHGGETVLNADNTASVLHGSGSTNNVNVSFNIAGGADESTVSRLRNFAEEIENRVLEAIADSQRDSMRRVYA